MGKKKQVATTGYQDIIWLAGKVFIDEGFVDTIEEEGFEAVYSKCPYGDLTGDQKQVFEDVFNRWEARLLVRIWWLVYRYLRKYRGVSAASSPWRP